MTSKRSALRFKCSGEKVFYKTAYEDGEAVLVDISIHGCALDNMSLAVDDGEILLLAITIYEEEVVEVQAEVVRSNTETAAVRFTIIERGSESTIRNYFSQKLRAAPKI